MHTSMLRTLGGSVAVTLPAVLVKSLGLGAGEPVNITAEHGGLLITPLRRRKYTAADLVAMQGDAPLHMDQEWDAMPATGFEAPL